MPAQSGKKKRSTYARRQRRNQVIIIGMVLLLTVALAAPIIQGAFSGSTDTSSDSDARQAGPCGALPDDVPEIAADYYDVSFGSVVDEGKIYTAVLETTCGDITIELDAQTAPLAVSNLLMLASNGYYNGVLFHRVIPGFVLQAGDPAGTGCGQADCTQTGFDSNAPTFPGYRFDDELDVAEALYRLSQDEQFEGLIADGVIEQDELDDALRDTLPSGYPRGVLAMANAGPDTNGSQFFLTLGEPTYLPGPQFTVFGRVTAGFEVLDRIAASPTDDLDRPRIPVAIYRIVVSAT